MDVPCCPYPTILMSGLIVTGKKEVIHEDVSRHYILGDEKPVNIGGYLLRLPSMIMPSVQAIDSIKT